MILDLVTFLQRAVPGIVPSGSDRWLFPLSPGGRQTVGLRIAPHWVCFELALPRGFDDPASPLGAVLRQSAWPGNVKLATNHSRLALCAEVPLTLDCAADRDWALLQLAEAVQALRAAAATRPAETAEDSHSGNDTDAELLADRCRAAGLNAIVKPDGKIHVDIETRIVRRVVSIESQKSRIRVRLTLDSGEPGLASDERLEAFAHFLWRASSNLRFARAWADGTATSLCAAGFECTIVPCAAESPLVSAIDALACACDQFACEAEALSGNRALASRYLKQAHVARRSVMRPVIHVRSPVLPVFPRAAAAAFPL